MNRIKHGVECNALGHNECVLIGE